MLIAIILTSILLNGKLGADWSRKDIQHGGEVMYLNYLTALVYSTIVLYTDCGVTCLLLK